MASTSIINAVSPPQITAGFGSVCPLLTGSTVIVKGNLGVSLLAMHVQHAQHGSGHSCTLALPQIMEAEGARARFFVVASPGTNRAGPQASQEPGARSPDAAVWGPAPRAL